jgi:hypothetical protein
MKIFLDLDGVLTDFQKSMCALMGVKLDRDKVWDDSRKLWSKVDEEGEKFWTEMEWQPGGKNLWEALKEYTPTILSSPTRHESSKTGKRKWVRENLGDDVKVILETKKEKYASPDAILVDDRKKNIAKWKEAGGIGVLHTDPDKTIDKVKELMSTNKEASNIKYVADPKNPTRRIVLEKLHGGRGTKTHTNETAYKRKREKDWRQHTVEGSLRVVLAYLSKEEALDNFKFRSHPVVIDPYDAIVQQALQKMGPSGRNVDVVKLEPTCPGDRVAWVANEDFFQGKKDRKRVVHLCLNKIKSDFKKAHGKDFNMTNAEDTKRMREVVLSYLKDVVLPHEETHIEQETKGEGQFGASPEVGAERAEDWSKLEQMGIKKKAGFFPDNYDPKKGEFIGKLTPIYTDKPMRREVPFSFKRLRTENLNYVRNALLKLKDQKATKIWDAIESGLQGDYSREQEEELKRIIQEDARDYSLSVGELINNLFGNTKIEDLRSSPVYQGITRKFAQSVVIRYLHKKM